MNAAKHAYFLSSYRSYPEEELVALRQRAVELSDEAALALDQVINERNLGAHLSEESSKRMEPHATTQNETRKVRKITWRTGYLLTAAGLLAPAIAKLNTKVDAIEVALFFMVNLAIWGSLSAGAIILWKKYNFGNAKAATMKSQKIQLTCPLCSRLFMFGPHLYDGKHISTYKLTICSSCYKSNHDGWAPQLEKTITSVLVANGESVPERNEMGLLPRDGR